MAEDSTEAEGSVVVEVHERNRERDSAGEMSAEAIRKARRDKILQNREERLQKILGPNSDAAAHRIVASTHPVDDDDPVLPEEFLTLDFLQKAKAQKLNQFGNQQGQFKASTTAIPRWKNYRIYLMLLGSLLPFFCNSNFIIYFLLFEMLVLATYRRIPVPPSPANMLFTLILLMGLKEPDVNRLKVFFRVTIWISKDICLFMVSSILPQAAFHLLYS